LDCGVNLQLQTFSIVGQPVINVSNFANMIEFEVSGATVELHFHLRMNDQLDVLTR